MLMMPNPWNVTITRDPGAPEVETSRAKHGNIQKIECAVWVVATIAFSLVTLRICYHLLRGRRTLWSDDIFLIAAMATLLGNAASIQAWVPHKYEPNVTRVASDDVVLAGSLMGTFNALSLGLVKTSLAITFMRLTKGWWKSSLGLAAFIIDFLYLVQGWTFWVQDCEGPTEPYRLQTMRTNCLPFESVQAFRLAVQILSCGLDAYFTILPWLIVRSLELKRFEKIGLAIAMSFGAASLSSGLVRLTVLIRLVHEDSEYQPFYAVGGYLYNYFEPTYSIIAACMPILRKIIMDIIQWKKERPKASLMPKWIVARRKKNVSPELPVTEVSSSFSEAVTLQGMEMTSGKASTTTSSDL